MSWAAIKVALLSFLNKLVGALPLIALWIANKKGETTGIEKQKGADAEATAEAQAEYAEIGTKGMTDEELDDKLDSGKF